MSLSYVIQKLEMLLEEYEYSRPGDIAHDMAEVELRQFIQRMRMFLLIKLDYDARIEALESVSREKSK
jgi:hypothetical protein